MPPVKNPVATIPYEIASDIGYAEKRLDSFKRWSFEDHKRAARGIIDAVEAYGRVWGKLADRNGFTMDQCRPYGIQLLRANSLVTEPLPADPIVDQAIEVSSAFAEFYANPLKSGTSIDKSTLLSELARRDQLAHMAKDLGDLVRNRVQEDYVRLEPGDWVRVPFRRVVGQVVAVNHCRVRVTAAERLSSLDVFATGHRYTTWDLVQNTLEKIPPPSPLPLCVPGLEWFHKALEDQHALDISYEQKSSNLIEIRTHAQDFGWAIEMLFRSEQPSDIMNDWTKGRHAFPEEYSAYFPDWFESRLRTYYEIAGQLQALEHETGPQFDPPPWDQPPPVVQALVELGREIIEGLAYYIADQLGSKLGAQVQVYGDYTEIFIKLFLDNSDEDIAIYEPKPAILVSHSGRTLTVKFDADEELPGLHQVDITEVTGLMWQCPI